MNQFEWRELRSEKQRELNFKIAVGYYGKISRNPRPENKI